MRALIVGLCLILVFGLARTDPDGNICARSCSVSGAEDVVYEPGKQYQYQYHGEVVSRSRSLQAEESRMSTRAYVIITARTQCDLKLQIMNLAFNDVPSSDSQWFKDAVEKHDLHFSYKNGMVSHICPHEEEDPAATNFKRGVLSAIQAKMTNLEKTDAVVYEADVLGECETEYRISQGSEILINKTKHSCRHNNYLPYIPSEHYSHKELKNEGAFHKAEQSCQMYLQDKVWQRVECVEEIKSEEFRDKFPFSVLNTAMGRDSPSPLAQISVNTGLTLEDGPENAPLEFARDGPMKRRETLRMDLEGAIKSLDYYKHETNIFEEVIMTMDYLMTVSRSDSGMTEKRPYAFSHLVELIGRVSAQEDMDNIWERFESQEGGRNFIIDATVLCESYVCTKFLARLAVEIPEVFPETRVLAWLTGVHFYSHPEPDAITVLMELASNYKAVEQQAVMAASSVVYAACQTNWHTCRTSAKPLLEFAEEKIGQNCGYGEPQEDRLHVKMALRALSNAGILSEKHFLNKCYMNKLLSSEIRTLALRAYRRVDCEALDLETPWQVLEDVSDDVDVRIVAYLSVVRCATNVPNFFTRIKDLLLEEKVNQVGSFIFTHVRNLAEKPDRNTESREISQLAHHHTLQAKFDTNAFRSSRNYRAAQYSQMLNLGASVESDFIFTPDSYVQRHESHRLHLDILENSIDALEIGFDLEHLEEFVYEVISKMNLFASADMKDMLEKLRPKRDIHDPKIEDFQRMYDEAKRNNGDDGAEDQKAGIYFRVFGNEVFYMDNAMQSDPLSFLRQLLKELSMPKSFQVLKQEFVTPTLLGFPLRMRVNATGSVNWDYKQKLLTESSRRFLFEPHIAASASLAMDEMLLVDAYGSSSGVRRRSSQVANIELGGKVSFENGEVVDLQLKLPNSEVMHVSSSVQMALYQNYKHGWDEKEYEGPSEKEEYCLGEESTRIFGLEYCSNSETASVPDEQVDVTYSDIYSSEFVVTKEDSFSAYQVLYKNLENTFEVLFDTPGSYIDRKVQFQVDLGRDHARGTFALPGHSFELKGHYENLEELKRVSLQYLENSNVLGEIKLSLPIEDDGDSFSFKPEVLVKLKNIFEMELDGVLEKENNKMHLEGNLMCDLLVNPIHFKALLDRTTEHHKAEGTIKFGSIFGSLSSTLFLNGEKTLVQIDSEFGSDANRPNTLSLTFDKTLVIKEEDISYTGYISMESSLGKTNIKLEYDYGSDYARTDSNITVMETDVSSHIILRNKGNEEERDFEVTLGFTSPKHKIDYLSQVIFKNSHNALQAEINLNLGSFVTSKAALTYAYEPDPLHALAGFHFNINDFIIQLTHEIDCNKPYFCNFISSDRVGLAAGLLQVDVDSDPGSPFNAYFSVAAGYDTRTFGVTINTTSDEEWNVFEGSTDVKWFDRDYSLKHELTWSENEKNLIISTQDGDHLELILKRSPEFIFKILLYEQQGGDNPYFKFGIENHLDEPVVRYVTYLQSYGNDMFHLTVTDLGVQKYVGIVKLMESTAEVSAQYKDREGNVEAKAVFTITFPSGDHIVQDLGFKHSYDGFVRQLELSLQNGEDVFESKMTMTHRDGWFNDDTNKLQIAFTTPFKGMKKIGMTFESHSDWSEPWLAEVEWEEFKIRGEAQLGTLSNLEAKVVYSGGGSCDSHFHIYNNFSDQQSRTGASLSITEAVDPWSVEVVTTRVDEDDGECTLDFTLAAETPLSRTPFEMRGTYRFLDTHIGIEYEAGADAKLKFSFRGNSDTVSEIQKFSGSVNFESPWTEPISLTGESYWTLSYFNGTLDLKTSLDYVHNVGTSFSVNSKSPKETTASFLLSHQSLQVSLEMQHSLSERGLKQLFQGTVNSVLLDYELDANWDKDFVPLKSEGRLALNGLFEHNFDVNIVHNKEGHRFTTNLSGTWDWHQFHINHIFENEPNQWKGTLEVILPGDKSINTEFFFNEQGDSAIECTIHFSSSWTQGFTANFERRGKGKIREYELEATYGSSVLFKGVLNSSEQFNLEKSDISLELSSSLFNDIKFSWTHNFVHGHLVNVDLYYSQDFYLIFKSHQKYNVKFFSNEFEGYYMNFEFTLPDPEISFRLDLVLDDFISGELEASFAGYYVQCKSSLLHGTIFSGLLTYPRESFQTELLYEMSQKQVQDFTFKFTHNSVDLLTFRGEFMETYPKFDVLFTLYYFSKSSQMPKNGRLKITADMSRIDEFLFNGLVKLNSNIEGYESYWAELDAGMNFGEKSEAHIDTQIHMNNWHYKAKLRDLIDFSQEFEIEHESEYEVTYGDQLYDKKKMEWKLSRTRNDVYEGFFTTVPEIDSSEWSLHFKIIRPELEFSGYVMPGNDKKYKLSFNISENSVTVNTHIVNEDGSQFTIIRGNVNWNLRKLKKQFTLNLNSDFEVIRKITGQVIVQQRRGLAANMKLRVNREDFTGILRYLGKGRNSGKILIKIENNIFMPFTTNTSVQYGIDSNEVTADAEMEVNGQESWAKASFKGSLKESYIRLNLPFEDFDNLDLAFSFEPVGKYGFNADLSTKFSCYDFITSVHFSVTKMTSVIDLKCSEERLFEVGLNYSFEESDTEKAEVKLFAKNYGNLLYVSVSGKLDSDETDLVVETDIYPDCHHSTRISWSSADKENEGIVFETHVTSLPTGDTHFLFKISFSKVMSEIEIEIRDTKVISFHAMYNIQQPMSVDSQYSHNIFGKAFETTLTASARYSEKSGYLEFHLTTNTAFDHADLTAKYDVVENLQAEAKLETTNGNADLTLFYGEQEYKKLQIDMHSDLHNFKNYQFVYTHEHSDDGEKVRVKYLQGDNEFTLDAVTGVGDNMQTVNVNIELPIDSLQNIDIAIGYTSDTSTELHYEGKIGVRVFSDYYHIDMKHTHAESWTKQETSVRISTPVQFLGTYRLSVTYDLNAQSSFSFESSEGQFGYKASWEYSRQNINIDVITDFSFFSLGEYKLMVNVPLKAYKKVEVKLTRHHEDLDFDLYLLVGDNFENGDFGFNEGRVNADNSTYAFTYRFKNNNLNLHGQWDKWDASGKIKFTGKKNSVSSGNFDIKTNIVGFEVVGGSWNFQYRKKVHVGEMMIDVGEKGQIRLDVSFSNLVKETLEAWQSVHLEANFESFFTKSHRLKAKYDLPELHFIGTYQHGSETFKVNFIASVSDTLGSISFEGNLPIKYISTFSVKFIYNFQEYVNSELGFHIEETYFDVRFELGSNRESSQLEMIMSSPYTNPLNFAFRWSPNNSPYNFEASLKYGRLELGIISTLEYSETYTHFTAKLIIPSEEVPQIHFDLVYDFSNLDNFSVSAVLELDKPVLKIQMKGKLNSTMVNLHASVSLNIYDNSGSITLEFEMKDGSYKARLSSEVNELETLTFAVDVSMTKLHISSSYEEREILFFSINSNAVVAKFMWNDFYIRIDAQYESKVNHQRVKIDVKSSEMEPLSLLGTFTKKDKYNADMKIQFGEKEYSLNGNGNFSAKESSLHFDFESSEDPYYPVKISAMYDFADFIQGKMKNEADLAKISLEWGERLEVLVKGQRRGKGTKLNVDIVTPFKALPELHFGYDGELISKGFKIVDFSINSFVEWSEKVSVSGHFKLKNDKFNLKATLTSTIPSLENLSVALQYNENRIETSISINDIDWEAVIVYEFSTRNSFSFTAKTPLNGFEDISCTILVETQENKLNCNVKLVWGKERTVEMKVLFEMWRLEISLDTPWEPIKDASFISSLQTESEELLITAALEWSSSATDLKIAVSPVEVMVKGNYVEDEEEIGIIDFGYRARNRLYEFAAKIETPFKEFNHLEAMLRLSSERCQVEINLPFMYDFVVKAESKNHWKELNVEGSFGGSYYKTPCIFKFRYVSEPRNDSFSCVLEVISDIEWISVNIALRNDINIEASVYDSMLELKFEKQNDLEYTLEMIIIPVDSEMESVNFQASANFSFDFSSVDVSCKMMTKYKNIEEVERHELQFTNKYSTSMINGDLKFISNVVEGPYELRFAFPVVNILENDVNFEFVFLQKDEEIYRATYDMVYPQAETFTHVVNVKSKEWISELTVSLTKSNFQIVFSFPDEEIRHSLVLSWPREISLEKLALQFEVSSPYLKEGDISFILDFTIQQKFYFTLMSSLTYGPHSIETNSKFQYSKRERKVVIETDVNSNWIGNHSVKLNINWMRNVSIKFVLHLMDQVSSVDLDIDVEEYTMQLIANFPWLSSEELVISGMVNKDFTFHNIVIEGKLQTEEEELLVEGRFESTEKDYINTYLTMRGRNKEYVRLSGLLRYEEKYIEVSIDLLSEAVNINYSLELQCEDSNEHRRLRFIFYDEGAASVSIKLHNSKMWKERQSLSVSIFGLGYLSYEQTVGDTEGEFEVVFRTDIIKSKFEVEYSLKDEYELEIYLQTPFDSLKVFKLELEWPVMTNKKEISLYYVWYDENINFKLTLEPISTFPNWTLGIYLTSTIKGYEKFSLQTPHLEINDVYNVLVEYPEGKAGLQLYNDCQSDFRGCGIEVSLHLPFEDYEVFSIKYALTQEDVPFYLEFRAGKVGITVGLIVETEDLYFGLRGLMRINEYKTESYIRFYKYSANRVVFHTDFELRDLAELKEFEIEYRHEPEKRFLIAVTLDGEDIARVHLGWGEDRIISLVMPKAYPAYVILNLKSTEDENNYLVEIGLMRSRENTWDVYGFHIYQRDVGYGRDFLISGETGENKFSMNGTVTLHPLYENNLYLKKKLIFGLNNNKAGFLVDIHTDFGYIEDSVRSDLQFILPNQSVVWDTSANYRNRKFDLVTKFFWDRDNPLVKPVALTVDYHDVSIAGQEHTWTIVFDHPNIKNLTLNGNLTRVGDSSLSVMMEFNDENAPHKLTVFRMNSMPGLLPDECIIYANISQPSSDVALEFSAIITETVLKSAFYDVRYWSQYQQKWKDFSVKTNSVYSEDGWQYNLKMNTSDSNWGYEYNVFFNMKSSPFFKIIGVSEPFMEFWSIETSVNKYLPEIDLQLKVGQNPLKPYEVGRIQAGLHSPLELGVIIDHERFGVWRQDVRTSLRLQDRAVLQLLFEFDPSLDFTDENVIYLLTSPASKISRAWLRDLSYTASAVSTFLSLEAQHVVDLLFSEDTIQTLWQYEQRNYEHFKEYATNSFSNIYEDLRDSWIFTVEKLQDGFYELRTVMRKVWLSLPTAQPFFEDAAFYLFENWSAFVDFVNVEMVRFHDNFIADMDRFALWWDETNQEMTVQFNNIMYEMVRSMNAFVGAMQHAVLELQRALQPRLNTLKQSLQSYVEELEAVLVRQCWPRIEQQFQRLSHSFVEGQHSLERFFQTRVYQQQLEFFKNWIIRMFGEVKEIYDDGMSQLEEAITESSLFETLSADYRRMKNILAENYPDGLYATVRRGFYDLRLHLFSTGDQLVHYLRQKYYNLQNYARGNLLFDYFEAVTGNAIDRVFETWQNWRAQEAQILNMFQRVFFAIIDFTKKLIQEESDTESGLIFDLKTRGKIIYSQYLPVPWNSFLEGPQWYRFVNIFQEDDPILKSKRKLAEGFDHVNSVFDRLAIPGSLFPPYTATATIFGQHVTTFDLHHYQFLGSCTYLLAKDFVDGDFEIIGDYGRVETGAVHLESVVVRANTASVTLHVNGTLDVSNIGNAEVHTGENTVAFKTSYLFVMCNKVSRGCSVTVHRKYFGKLAGMFGNYNHEPSDDSEGPDGSRVENGEDIANQWAVSSGTCYQQNLVKKVKNLSQISNFERCLDLYLRDKSPFSKCFLTIDPRPYFWQCVRDLERPDFGQEGRNTPCQSAYAYRTQCASHFIQTQPAAECTESEELKATEDTEVDESVTRRKPSRRPSSGPAPPRKASETCSVNEESVPVGWSKIYEKETQGSADVAFIIELANCNKDRNLQLLQRLIKVQLKRAGIQDVQYALIKTQGDSFEMPSSMISEDEIAAELGNLEIDGPKAEDGGAEAVKEVARRLKWRPGVTRNIVHLPCRACDDGPAVAEALAENDITYHILTKFKVEVNGPNAKKSKAMSAKVWGFDKKRVFTPKDSKKFAGNAGWRKLMRLPEEPSCMEAAQNTGGSIYNINKWTSKNLVAEKKYLGVIGQSVLKTSSAPECQECRCLGGNEGLSCRKCGEEFPAVEEAQETYPLPEDGEEDEGRETSVDEGRIAEEIKKNFEQQFIDENAALEHLEGEETDESAIKDEDGGENETSDEDDSDEEEYDYEYDYNI
ncbi:hypothetical protein SK128_015888 [Halocaridina rubra]|uniref:Vitellogenin domain-containing protein n=1 Tax=Halocaridina rubra TaxID=373956 RepID=A0AAN8X9E0_HALRR